MEHSPFSEPQLTAMLCDAAQAPDNKLYILGGGWTQIVGYHPTNMAIALQLTVPWSRSNEVFRIKANLTNQDSPDIINLGPGPVETDVGTEVGRPPGLPRGTALISSLVFDFPQIALAPGGYVWNIYLNNVKTHHLAFVALDLGLPRPPYLPEPED